MHKPIEVLKQECLASCKFCGELYSTILVKHHESSCPKVPVSDIVADFTSEFPPNLSRTKLTEQDLLEYRIQKNLLASYNKILSQSYQSGGIGFINHVITPTDTISGIALRYGITTADLRRANHLVGNGDQAFHQHTVLRIPSTAAPQQMPELKDLPAINVLKRRLVARFAHETSCPMDESQYYLEANHYNLDLALTEFRLDDQVPLPPTISHHVPNKSLIISTDPKSNPRSTCCDFP